MGSYVFNWDRPANEVFVTGTFDDWAKSVKLEKRGTGFEKRVELPATKSKIYYKFVVDGNWTTNANEPQEADENNNVNNILTADRLKKPNEMADRIAGATISGATPNSTTAQLAGEVPKEADRSKDAPPSSDVPGGFPETPYHDAQEFSAKPLPASSGVGNPISLKPGEKVPDSSEFATNDTTTADTLDKESYEKSGDGPSALGGASNIQSSGPDTTTAALAGQVPKEPNREAQVISDEKPTEGASKATPIAPQVPDVVQESITASNNAPEAAANKEAVKEKAAVESELLQDIKTTDTQGEPAPSTSATVADKAPAPTATQDTKPTNEPASNPTALKTARDEGPDSRDVSPLSHPKGPSQPPQPTQPTVTTGPATSKAPETSTPPKTESPASPVSNTSASATTDKKAKRGSIFGRLKEKLKK